MFEDNHNERIDDLMRSVLGEVQEEVPVHIWATVSSRLDEMAAAKIRKPVMIRLWRTAAAVAVAAAIAAGIFLSINEPGNYVPETADNSVISVIRDDAPAGIHEFIAKAENIPDIKRMIRQTAVMEAESDPEEVLAHDNSPAGEIPSADAGHSDAAANMKTASIETYPLESPEDVWEETDTPRRNKARTSLTFSGNIGTNNAQNLSSGGPLRRPSISAAKPKTGIRQTSTESIYGLPVSFGAGIRIGLTPRWSLGTGLTYTLLNRKFYGTYTHVNGDGVIDKTISSDIRNTQHYIGIPVNVFYSIMDRNNINFYVYAGGAAERCISDKYSLIDTSISHREEVKGIQVSASAGLGVEFMLGKHMGLYIDPRLRYYFKNSQPKSIRTAQPLLMEFEMGLRFNL